MTLELRYLEKSVIYAAELAVLKREVAKYDARYILLTNKLHLDLVTVGFATAPLGLILGFKNTCYRWIFATVGQKMRDLYFKIFNFFK